MLSGHLADPGPVALGPHLVALRPQRRRDRRADGEVVLDEQDAGLLGAHALIMLHAALRWGWTQQRTNQAQCRAWGYWNLKTFA